MTECVGTPFYRAPEQESSAEYDQMADIFSLGVIFYEMVRCLLFYTDCAVTC